MGYLDSIKDDIAKIVDEIVSLSDGKLHYEEYILLPYYGHIILRFDLNDDDIKIEDIDRLSLLDDYRISEAKCAKCKGLDTCTQKMPGLKMDLVYDGILYDRLSDLGASLLKETLPSILEGTNESIVQDESRVTYAPTLTREDERIDWNLSARQVYNHVRGTNPWPGSFTTYQGKTVKIWAGKVHQCENAVKHHAHQDNGTIVKIFKDAIGVKVHDGVYLITELQVEGKKRMSVKDYLNGHCMFEVDTKFE